MFKESITVLAIVAGLVATTAQARDGGEQREARFAQIDTNSDGQVTADELTAQAAARFAAADANNDGALTVDEMKAQMQEHKNGRMLKRFDTNEDGKLSDEEMAKAADGRMGKRMTKRFEKMDADNSGSITLEEMTARGDPAKMIAKLDKDKSGGVSLEEFANARGHGKGGHGKKNKD